VKSKDAGGRDDTSPPPAAVPARQEPAAVVPLPEPVEAVLEQVPAPQREKIRESLIAMLQVQGPAPNPVLQKLTATHIEKLIDGADKDNERALTDRRESRSQTKFLAIAGMVGFLILSGLFLWGQQTQLLDKVIQAAIIFAGGLGAGIGLSKRRSR